MKVIIAAAGTAGHINPGIAIANRIKKEEPNSQIMFIGTNRGLENDLVSRAGYKLKTINAYGLKKEISINNFNHILETLKSRKEASKIMDEFKPDVVIGTGGYICGPVFWGALRKKLPTVLHESNAYPGKAVKVLSKKVDKILVGFEAAKKYINCKNIVVTGNPTKINKKIISQTEKNKILHDMGIKTDLPIVLVFGGSQGAQKINEAMMHILKNKLNTKYHIIWATGQNQYDIIKDKFEKDNIYISGLKNVKIVPYIYNMEEMMNLSDLLVCRSGAMTITEIAICEKPAIFVPLPSQSANRQEDNARVLEKIGAAKIILNENLNGEELSTQIDNLVLDLNNLKKMGENAGKIAIPNVEDKIYLEIKNVIRS